MAMVRHRSIYACAAIIALMTFALYLPALGNGFVWDDFQYVVQNDHIRSINPAFIRWALTDSSINYWHPLAWLSLAIDYALWGLNPAGYHLTGIVLHAINTFLVVVFVVRLVEIARARPDPSVPGGDPGAAASPDERSALITGGVAGALFGLHPLHVESAAWIAERKDLLCALFFLLCIIAHVDSVRGQRGRAGEGWRRTLFVLNRHSVLSFVFFVLALSGKPMAVTLPVVLLLLDWYPLRRAASLRMGLSSGTTFLTGSRSGPRMSIAIARWCLARQGRPIGRLRILIRRSQ